MANVYFTVTRELPLPADVVFSELIDWKGLANWVPLTRVPVLCGDGGPGTNFVATTGIGPFSLPDRMRVDDLDPVAMTSSITKIGPLLTRLVHPSIHHSDQFHHLAPGLGRGHPCPRRAPVPREAARRGRPEGIPDLDHPAGSPPRSALRARRGRDALRIA